jgi:hypothetical protein
MAAATLAFGSCELRMRRADRLNVLDLYGGESAALAGSALEHNQRGLQALKDVRVFVERLGAHELDDDTLGRWREASGGLRESWRQELAELDTGESDTRHLITMAEDAFAAVDSDGLKGLSAFMGAKLEELESVRSSKSRGTEARSFPWWKLVAAAIWLGFSVYAIINALNRGAAWWDIGMIIFIALIGIVLIALGC